MAWPGPQDGLGQGGPRLKWAKGRSGSENDEKVKVLRMELSIVENLSGLQESIFSLSRGPQLNFGEKSKKNGRILLNLPIFPLSPCLGSLGLLSFGLSIGSPRNHTQEPAHSFWDAASHRIVRPIYQ